MENDTPTTTNSLEGDVRFHVYRHFVETGRAPTIGEIASALDIPLDAVERSLRRLADDHMLVLAPGSLNVWMAHPFSAVPTPYPVETPERRYWANCAWDALAIPALLDVDARTATTCPDCAEPLTLRTRAGQLEATGAVVHFAVPPRRFWDNVGFT
jgi:hypothetical protein